MNSTHETLLTRAVAALQGSLGDNLYSCCLYGSAVRGNAIDGISDLNLLIVLTESDSAAHEAVAVALADFPQIDPFILAKRGFARSARAFAPKFASIRRHHRVLHGADPLAELTLDPELERFLCEQGLRNLRLRLVYAYVQRRRLKHYDQFVRNNVTPFFVQCSEVLRLHGTPVPAGFPERIPIFAREFGIDAGVLAELLALKQSHQRLTDPAIQALHARFSPVIEGVLTWMERHWAE